MGWKVFKKHFSEGKSRLTLFIAMFKQCSDCLISLVFLQPKQLVGIL